MTIKKIDIRENADTNQNNVDVLNGVKFPEGRTLRFCFGRKETENAGNDAYTYNSYNDSAYKIDLFTTLGTFALSTLRSEPIDFLYPNYQVTAPNGTLNRFVIDYIEAAKEKAYADGIEVNDGFIAQKAVEIIGLVIQKYGGPTATIQSNTVAFTIHRVPYYSDTYKNGEWIGQPRKRVQVHLYLPNTPIPAVKTHADIDANFGTAQPTAQPTTQPTTQPTDIDWTKIMPQ